MLEGNSCGEISGHTKVSQLLSLPYRRAFKYLYACYSASMLFLSDNNDRLGQSLLQTTIKLYYITVCTRGWTTLVTRASLCLPRRTVQI